MRFECQVFQLQSFNKALSGSCCSYRGVLDRFEWRTLSIDYIVAVRETCDEGNDCRTARFATTSFLGADWIQFLFVRFLNPKCCCTEAAHPSPLMQGESVRWRLAGQPASQFALVYHESCYYHDILLISGMGWC